MLIASFAYPAFVLSAVYIISPVMVLLAILIGGCAALLNIAQGVLQTECCNDANRGVRNGIFMAFNQGAGLVGNLAAVFLMSSRSRSGSDNDDVSGRTLVCPVAPLSSRTQE